jgi:nucleoside-diphosphate-sugar epimerase
MKRYFVTGAAGFIGTNVVEALIRQGKCVLGFDVSPVRVDEHKSFFVRGSLLDEGSLFAAMQEFRPTHVIHLGARTDLGGKTIDEYPENTLGVETLIRCCDAVSSIERVVFASSRLVCEIGYIPSSYEDYKPTTAYGESKVAGEQIVKSLMDRRWDWCIVRPTSIWGPWFDVPYRNFFDMVRNSRYLHPSGARIRKSFGFVGNVVYEILALANADGDKVSRKCFYVGDYEMIEVFEFAQKIAKEFGVPSPRQVPLWVLKLAAGVGDALERIGVRSPLTSFRLDNLLTPMPHDFRDLKEAIGDIPFGLDEGVKLTVEWMRNA